MLYLDVFKNSVPVGKIFILTWVPKISCWPKFGKMGFWRKLYPEIGVKCRKYLCMLGAQKWAKPTQNIPNWPQLDKMRFWRELK